jgi:hypothetical protein
MAVGIITGAMALSSLVMCLTVAQGGGVGFLLLFTLSLAVVSGAAFTAKYEVALDVRGKSVKKTVGALNLVWNEQYALRDFRAVGIVTGGRSAAGGGSTTVYSVQMVGKTNVKLPGGSSDRDSILSSAKEVADYVSLPLDDEPRMGFFGARI